MKTQRELDQEVIERAKRYVLTEKNAGTNGNGHQQHFTPEFTTAAELMAADFPEPRWAVPGILPDGLTLLVGRPKQGKSWLLLGLGLSIAYGGKAFGQKDVEQGDVLLLCLEDNRRRLQDRMRMMLNGETAPGRLVLTTVWPRLDQGGGGLLDTWLTEHPGARLVGIDVLQRMRPKSIGEGRLYEQDYEVMASLKKIADAHGVAIVVVHHTRKADAEDPFDLISGTTGIAGGIDTGLVLMRERSQADAVLYVRGRDVNEQELAMGFDGITGQWNLLGDADVYRTSQERLAIVTALREHGGEMSVKEITVAVGKKETNTRMLLSKMLKDNEVNAGSAPGRYTIVPWA